MTSENRIRIAMWMNHCMRIIRTLMQMLRHFTNFYEDAEQELYPGCRNFSSLSFLVRLFHIKRLSGWSNKSFNMLLDLLIDAFPEGVQLPKNIYETKKVILQLELSYDRIDACPNDCMLY